MSTTPSPTDQDLRHVVIIGSGIIGVSTAYFLSLPPHSVPLSITLIDSSPRLFHCASGLAGGFLAEDWFPPSTAPLGALSFRLHRQLAQEHEGHATWGYTPSTAWSLTHDGEVAIDGSGEDWLAERGSRAATARDAEKNDRADGKEGEEGPKWLKRVNGSAIECISQGGTTAQVDPKRFCEWLLSRCRERGVEVVYPAKVVGLVKNEERVLRGVRVLKEGEEMELPCTHLAVTAGPWTPRVFSFLFPCSNFRIPISSIAGHSLLVKNSHLSLANPEANQKEEMCHAIFATETDALDFSPEWFARAGGELYLAGLNSTTIPLPEVATGAKADEHAIEKLRECAGAMVRKVGGREVEVLREGLCFRPVTASGRPIISRISDAQLGGFRTLGRSSGGVFVAAGHGAWGISLGPGTGHVLAELMGGRKPSVQIAALELPGI